MEKMHRPIVHEMKDTLTCMGGSRIFIRGEYLDLDGSRTFMRKGGVNYYAKITNFITLTKFYCPK